MQGLEQKIDALLAVPPYSLGADQKNPQLLELLQEELKHTCQRHAGLRNYLEHWPVDFRSADRVCALPFLPVSMLKTDPPLALVEPAEIKRTLTSSATTGQTPSRVVLDSATSRRMTKGVIGILQDFIGSARRPYLVVDFPGVGANKHLLGARAAAIQGLQPFASELTHCLRLDPEQNLELERDRLLSFAHGKRSGPVLIYGFTYILWNHLVKPLAADGICLGMGDAYVLHSGGWKRLQEQAVQKEAFNRGVAQVVGCTPERVIDFYGMVENVGIIYPDCSAGNKHAPSFGEVILRDPLTLEPVAEGEIGIIQVCSVLPTSFPGHLLLTEDMAQLMGYDGCSCGRHGIYFRFVGRVPKAEPRGCGNIQTKR